MRKIVLIPIVTILITIIAVFSLSSTFPESVNSDNLTQAKIDEISSKYVKTYRTDVHTPKDIGSGNCRVSAPHLMDLFNRPDFGNSEKFSNALNFDKESLKITIPCEKIPTGLSTFIVKYMASDSPIQANEMKLQILPMEIVNAKIYSDSDVEPYVITEKNKVVVIDPIFTGSAYQNGFYEYWNDRCDDSCLNVPICFDCVLIPDAAFGQSINAVSVFKQLNYPIITDYDFGVNPELIFDYETVIMLHSEYVTKEMFDAMTSHPKVMYLYPNALEKEIGFNSTNIWLIHKQTSLNYTNNYFDWEYENTHPYEFDRDCENWQFREISQGVQLMCFPEQRITEDLDMIKYIHEFIFST